MMLGTQNHIGCNNIQSLFLDRKQSTRPFMVKTRICTATLAINGSATRKTWSPGSIDKPLSKASLETGVLKVNPGKFGRFGGTYVPETMVASLKQLETEFNFVLQDTAFQVCN